MATSGICLDGAAPGGAAACVAERWTRTRTYHHARYTARRIAAERTESVSVCLPARECAGTVGAIVRALAGLREAGAIDEIVVVDAASPDGTAAVARRAGAKVYQESELPAGLGVAPGGRLDGASGGELGSASAGGLGPVLGKGDAMWRALSALEGELVCFLDADTEGFQAHFATGLLGPLVCEPGVQFAKAFYRRPFEQGGVSLPEGGGRVNHLMARPALALFYPELAGVRQPLAGEVAARRELLERLPFATGYGVEVAMLIDAWREVGLEGLAQVDLEVHRNRHQPLQELTPMAYTVLATIARRLRRDGRLHGVDGEAPIPLGASAWRPGADAGVDAGAGPVAPIERPPLASMGAA
jgi:glucosyl-3-phosphoglycerate synthase